MGGTKVDTYGKYEGILIFENVRNLESLVIFHHEWYKPSIFGEVMILTKLFVEKIQISIYEKIKCMALTLWFHMTKNNKSKISVFFLRWDA